jgi:nicotinamidase-related amidase
MNDNSQKTKTAIIVVDMINDFVDGVLGSSHAQDIVPAVSELLAFGRRNNMPCIFTNDSHLLGIDRELKLWGDHGIKDTEGSQVVPALKPIEGDYVVTKRRYSAFFQTDLELTLRELGVNKLIIAGVATNICVQSTAIDALYRNYEIVIPKETTASFDPEARLYSLEYLKTIFGAEIVDLDNVLSSAADVCEGL